MRRTVRCGAILALFLTFAVHLDAEPILRGYRVDPASAVSAKSKVPQGKSLVLAQIFNSQPQTLDAGEFEVGMEITVHGKTKSFSLKPRVSVLSGSMRTFPLIVPQEELPDDAMVNVFARHAGKTFQAQIVKTATGGIGSLAGKTSTASAMGITSPEITTLYTEAPPEADAVQPPPEVPFENQQKNARSGRHAVSATGPEATVSTGRKPAPTTAAPEMAKATATAKGTAKGPAQPMGSHDKVTQGQSKVTQGKVTQDQTTKVTTVAAGKAQTSPEPGANHVKAPVISANGAPKPPDTQTAARVINDNEFKSLRTIDEELVIYVIKQGDSLASVAQKYYGSAAKDRIIADLNFIENPKSVKVGEEIIVDVRPLAAKKKGSKS